MWRSLLVAAALLCGGANGFTRPPAHRASAPAIRRGHVQVRLAAEDGGGFLAGLKDAAINLFKPKQEDPQRAAIAKRQKEIDKSVDALMGGTGLFGAVMAPLLKQVGGALTEAVAQQGEDIGAVLAALDSALQRDLRVSRSLGGSVAAGSPMQQSYSSMNVNGVTRKMITLIVPVTGARARGTAQVQAALEASGVKDLQVVFSGPGVGQIRLSSDGQYGSASGAGDVIDVDVIDV